GVAAAPRRPGGGRRRVRVASSGGTGGAPGRRHQAGTDAPCRMAGGGGGAVLATGTPAICGWGVVSSVVLGGGESLRQGEGLDGSPPPGKATHPGQVGPEQHAPTSLRARANKARAGNGSAWRGSECNRGTGGGKTARPGLHGGRRVTGVPTVAALQRENRRSCQNRIDATVAENLVEDSLNCCNENCILIHSQG